MEVRIVVDNRVRVCLTGLPENTVRALQVPFEHDNPQWGMNKRLGLPVWKVPKTIITWERDEDRLSLPRGSMVKVREVLSADGFDWVVVDERRCGRPSDAGKTPRHHLKLRKYQADALEKLVAKQNCILRAPTGSGKTSILIAVASRIDLPTLVVVHSQALLDQWLRRLVNEMGMKPTDIGIIQGKKRKLRPMTMAIQKSLANATANEDLVNYFGAVLADEVHLFAAATFFECIDPFPAKYRIGASADERRKDKKEFLIHDLFAEVAAEIERDDLIKSGDVLDVEILVVPTEFTAAWYGLATEENPELQIDFGRLLKEIQADEDRNQLIFDTVQMLAPSRKKQALLMAHEREHIRELALGTTRAGVDTGILFGGPADRKEFEDNLELLMRKQLSMGAGTYKAIGTGVDLPNIGLGFACTPIAGNEQFFGQVRGRLCRAPDGKNEARLVYFWDRHVYPSHLRNLVRWNNQVKVLVNNDWIPGKDFLKGI